jgi:hypothetical protein
LSAIVDGGPLVPGCAFRMRPQALCAMLLTVLKAAHIIYLDHGMHVHALCI